MSGMLSLAFEPGQQIQCTTRFDDIFRGEVVAFDLSSRILILKAPSSSSLTSSSSSSNSTPAAAATASATSTTTATTTSSLSSSSSSNANTNHDLHFLMLDSVLDGSIEILKEPQAECNKDLPSIEMKYISAKLKSALNERRRLVTAVENGVSQDGISLYTAFSKMYASPSDVTWKDNVKIVVLNQVIISPPYKEANCEALSSKTPRDAVAYAKSYVQKYWDNCAKQTATT